MMSRWLAGQLALPRGFGGRIVGRLMNRWNAAVNHRAVTLLGVEAGDAVLEIGFGGGATLERLLTTTPAVRVAGLEQSATMAATARARFAGPIAEGRVTIETGDVEALPYADRSFDRIITVNVVYFWEDLPAALEELCRVLRPGGTLVLAYRPAAAMREYQVTKYGFRLIEDEALLEAVHAAGLEAVALERGTDGPIGYRCLVATPLV
jgi:ubiquinone/menaquinone biosynthesis C-methylase UbiE